LTSREIADAYEAALPSLRREFDISVDSLKLYIVNAEGHVQRGRKRISLTFEHPGCDTGFVNQVRFMVSGFPNYFEVTYFPGTKAVQVTWTATPAQKLLAHSIAEPYIQKHLGIGLDSLKGYHVKYFSYIHDDQKRVALDYLYRKTFPNPEGVSGIMGGYPSYFSITIDVKSKRVVQLYASTY